MLQRGESPWFHIHQGRASRHCREVLAEGHTFQGQSLAWRRKSRWGGLGGSMAKWCQSVGAAPGPGAEQDSCGLRVGTLT